MTAPDSILTATDTSPLSLNGGTLGTALLYLATGSPPETVHTLLRTALADGPIDPASRNTLFHGLPAVAFLLSLTPPEGYRSARTTVREHLIALTRHRLAAATRRIEDGRLTSFAEYDLITGLTGIGVALRSIDPDGDLLDDLLRYLVRLTRPIRHEHHERPGWWVHHGPQAHPDPDFPEGHANLGLAHGISGVLGFLALTHRDGRTVDGHTEALERLCAALDEHEHHDGERTWWPGWVSTGHPAPLTTPGPPSWCYGTPGIARARQLAALALGDTPRRLHAEQAMDTCLSDPRLVNHFTYGGLCHGPAGLLQVLRRMSEDQPAVRPEQRLERHLTAVREHAAAPFPHRESGLLEGKEGTTMALAGRASALAWDRCMLLV
ncbi:lanthionine synthetase C family protein [Nocardiopsis lambiniae]|uniref:Lanthionine synthetase C family protein n=1 Tax=Nocardiopsis lambiniae TaxID=3075539 RepID=A0ABU2MHC8_9ACTN|nr:lanthionine synthetase C family protein [Nocardiopsis sp. DSM 44743]MDT0331460.1 lanthionine synthetase C family protein [Nocardiopsis sp. DSM 44743]